MPPTVLDTWVPLDDEARVAWLRAAADRRLATDAPAVPDQPPGTVFVIRGELVRDVSSFLCSLGEAINGPGGYFGHNLFSLEDCCVAGGFGVVPPFVIRWLDLEESRAQLGHAALARWLSTKMAGRTRRTGVPPRWLPPWLVDASAGRGPTAFDWIVAAIGVGGSTIEAA